MAGLGKFKRRRTAANVLMESRITGGPSTGSVMPIAMMLFPPNRRARNRAPRVRSQRLDCREIPAPAWETSHTRLVGYIRIRRLVSGGLCRRQMRACPRHQPADRHIGLAVREGSPIQKTFGNGSSPVGNAVFITIARKSAADFERQCQAENTAPVLHHKRDIVRSSARTNASRLLRWKSKL